MALPVTITGISTAVAPVGPFQGFATYYTITTGTGSFLPIGNNAYQQVSQSFSTPASGPAGVTTAIVKLWKVGTPADGLQADIYLADSAGVPVGTSLATSTNTIPGSAVSGISTVTFFFASVALLNSTKYAVIVKRTGSLDESNYYGALTSTTNVDATQTGGYYDGASWLNASYDFSLTVQGIADAYYFFGRDGTTATTLQAFKSTAPDTSWASVTTKTGFTTAILGLSSYQVGNVIHIAVMDGTLASSIAHKYVSFDMATDTFATTETIMAAANPAGQIAGAGAGNSIVVRSTGEAVVLFNSAQTNTSGTPRARLSYSRRTGVNTWASAVRVDANIARDNRLPIVVLGQSDRCHFTFHDGTSLNQRHLTSGNVLGTASAVASTITVLNSDMVTINDSGTIRHVGFVAGSTAIRFTSADNPTISTSTFTSDLVRGVDDNGVVYGLYQNSADSDLYIKSSSDFGATWGTATNVFTGTVTAGVASLSKNQLAYQRGSNVVFPYVVNDGGTLKYNERTLRTLVVAYTLTADKGSVTLAGVATGLRADRRLTAATGAVELAGTTTGLSKGYWLPAAAGDVTLAGQPVNLTYGFAARVLTANVGAVALAGTAAGLRAARRLVAESYADLAPREAFAGDTMLNLDRVGREAFVGSVMFSGTDGRGFVVIGQAINLVYHRGYSLPVTTGSVVVTFNDAALTTTSAKKLIADTGAITFTGYAAGLRGGLGLLAAKGSIVLAGQDAALRHTHVLTATTGAVALSGEATTLRHASVLPAAVGAVTLIGYAADLRKASALGLAANTGTVTVALQSATLRRTIKMPITAGAVLLSGQVTTLRYGRMLPAAKGAVTVAGQVTALRYGHIVTAAKGAVTLTGYAADLRKTGARSITANTGAITLSGQAATLRAARVLKAEPSAQPGDFVDDNGVTSFIDDLGATLWVDDNGLILGGYGGPVAVTGYAATLTYGAVVNTILSADAGAVTVAGQAATLRYGQVLIATPGAVTVTFNDAALNWRRFLRMVAAPGGIVLSGVPVGLSTAANKSLAAVKGDILLSGKAAALRVERKLPALSGPILVTGLNVNLDAQFRVHYRLGIAPGDIVLTGQQANLLAPMTKEKQPGPLVFGRRLVVIPGRW